MQPDLSDLLKEAKSDPPPARYGVDDVVAAGRRQLRRRNAGLAVAAVVAVAAAIGVPQIASRHSGDHPIPAATSIAPTVKGTAYRFDYPFRGYTAAGYRVFDPTEAQMPGAAASIQKVGTTNPRQYDGELRVYRAGIDPRMFYPGHRPAEQSPVKGRPAYAETSYDGTPNMFAWQFAADQWAAISTIGHNMDQATVRKIAEGFTPRAAQPATTPLTIGWVPAGYRLIGGRARPDTGDADRSAAAGLTFVNDKSATTMVKLTDRDAAKLTQAPPDQGLFVSLSSLDKPYPTEPTCDEAGRVCSVAVHDGHYRLDVTATAVSKDDVSTADLLRLLNSTTVNDLTRTSQWDDLSTSVPVTSRLAEQ